MRNQADFYDAGELASRPPLTQTEMDMLDHERSNPHADGRKVESVLRAFDMSLTSYYSRLNQLRSHPHAVEYAPDVVRRMNQKVDEGARRLHGWR